MLIDFSFYNFRSFAEETTFSMIADSKETKNKFRAEKFELLKTAAIYGPNAGGKSNLFKAFKFYADTILNSSKFDPDYKINIKPFKLNKKYLNEPSVFECRFIINGIYHRYGFSIKDGIVESEWLYYRPKGREAKLFERDGQEFNRGNFKEAKGVEGKTKENTLFLSSLAQWNSEKAKEIMKYFKNINFISMNFPIGIAIDLIDKGLISKETFLEMLKNADMEITDFKTEKIEIQSGEHLPKRALDDSIILTKDGEAYYNKIVTYHSVFNKGNNRMENIEFDFLEEESDGTKKYFGLLAPLLATLKNGSILFIDELDTRIHPLLLMSIIKLFHSDKNAKNAQLIFTTHNTNILNPDLFGRDQIWFVKKDEYGQSILYSLLEIKGVRKGVNFEKEYLEGRYGAVPYLKKILEEFKI